MKVVLDHYENCLFVLEVQVEMEVVDPLRLYYTHKEVAVVNDSFLDCAKVLHSVHQLVLVHRMKDKVLDKDYQNLVLKLEITS
jgi:hypothetical protein